MNQLVQKAFDSRAFRETGHKLIDQLADHLDQCKEGNNPVLSYIHPDKEYEFWKNYQLKDANIFFSDIIDRNIHVHHKHYIGHQVSAPAPFAALAGLVADLLNDGMGIYEMGAAATAIERVVIEEYTKAIGFDNQASGVLTSGGTLANLTALLAARAHFSLRFPDEKPFIIVSDQAHYCIERAAITMGMQASQVIKIGTDQSFKIDISLLQSQVDSVLKRGDHIMAIIACACSTSTGSYDELEAIAAICQRNEIWMHVDGAHGGGVIFSHKYKHLCNGLNKADSIVIDAHKMMLTPALATAVVFKRPEDSYRSLETEASYLFERKEAEWYNLTKRTYETTKYMMSIKIFLLMRLYGNELFSSFITRQYDLAREFAQLIEKHKSFELGHNPMSNIVCFRYSASGIDYNFHNKYIREKSLLDGQFYIVQTTLKDQVFLRVTIMSPHTTIHDLKSLLRYIILIAEEV